jgi:predicted HicB family RNase H-like nuclease
MSQELYTKLQKEMDERQPDDFFEFFAPAYKGYMAFVYWDDEENCLLGDVVGTEDTISFRGANVAGIVETFKEMIDGYLEGCEKGGIEPNKPLDFSVNPFTYKGYTAKAEYDPEYDLFHGTYSGESITLCYEGKTLEEANADFTIFIDCYLEQCKEEGSEPEYPLDLLQQQAHSEYSEA